MSSEPRITACTTRLPIRIYCILYLTWLARISQSFRAEYTVRRGPASDVQCMSLLTGTPEDFPDAAFTASSSLYDSVQYQPAKSRLTEVYGSKEHTSGHAWCPNSPVGESLRDWIQAEFPHLVMISTIFTAGRGDGNVKEFMPSFVLKYQREADSPWLEHTKLDGTRILKANSDPRNLARVTLDTVVIAKRIRIYPYSRKSNQLVCLRFALLGCKFPDGVVSYSMAQGSSPPPMSHNSLSSGSRSNLDFYNLRDLSYDGQLIDTSPSRLTDGMGQLMDNLAYLGNVTNLVPLHPGQPGFHFVGWQLPPVRQQQIGPSGVQIDFKFDALRSFTWARLFTFDSVPLQARLFNRVVLAFSRDGEHYENAVETFTSHANLIDPRSMEWFRLRVDDHHIQPSVRPKRSNRDQPTADLDIYTDREFHGALVLQIRLHDQVGRYVRLTLAGGDRWILLSEVQFNSSVITEDEAHSAVANPMTNRKINEGGETKEGPDDKTVKGDINYREGGSGIPGGNIKQQGQSKSGHLDVGEKNRPSEDSPGSHSLVPLDHEKSHSQSDLLTSDLNHVTLLPFIIVLACLLCLIPSILLLWFCSRRRCACGRSPLYCHRKAFLHSTPTVSSGQSSTGVKDYSRQHEAATKLIAAGACSAVGNGTMPQLLTGLLPHQPQHLHSPSHHAHYTCSSSSMDQTNNTTSTKMMSPVTNSYSTPGAAAVNSSGNGLLPVSLRPSPHTGVILPCSPSSSCSSHTAAVAGTIAQETIASLAIGAASSIYAGAGDASCMSPEYASASIFSFTPPPSDQASTILPPNTVTPTTSSVPSPPPAPPPLPPNRTEHLRPLTSLPSTFALPPGHVVGAPLQVMHNRATTLGPFIGQYPTSVTSEDPSLAASTLQRRFNFSHVMPWSQGGINCVGDPGVVSGDGNNGLLFLPQSSFDAVIPTGGTLSQPLDIDYQSDGQYREAPGVNSQSGLKLTGPVPAILSTALYQSTYGRQLIIDPNQLPSDLHRRWQLANLHNSNHNTAQTHWLPDGTLISGSGIVGLGQQRQQFVSCQPLPVAGFLPANQLNATTPMAAAQSMNTSAATAASSMADFGEAYRTDHHPIAGQTVAGYQAQSSTTGTSTRRASEPGNRDEAGRLSLYSMCA